MRREEAMRVLGFMTGTSLDGVDVALIETDGESRIEHGPWCEAPMPESVKTLLEETTQQALQWPRGQAEPDIFDKARSVLRDLHLSVMHEFLQSKRINISEIDLVGIHGQTVLHERPTQAAHGRTVQLFDGQGFADQSGLKTVCDFRTKDVAAGGEGAPLAPVYHKALVAESGLESPVVWVNLGGVANITVIGDGDPVAFDTGPANGLMDQWAQRHDVGHHDEGGQIAASGHVHQAILDQYMSHAYFHAPAPKSLDRYQFSLEAVESLSLADGMATLSRFTIVSLIKGIELISQKPKTVVLSGGGRHNAHLCKQLIESLPGVRVIKAEDMGWRGGAIEAEAFAYIAVRCVKGLPISFPTTTGVPQPMTGGVAYEPNRLKT